MSELTHLSLFSGVGGLDLAAEWAGFQTVGQCEWADYPRGVLQKHWPDVPKWRDIRTLTKEGFRERTELDTVTVLSGGFPCQPFSTAGKRRGKEDDRYLWPEMLRVISEIRPAWVVGENVAGLVSLALDTVLSDLEGIGYACQTLIIPACAVDAPHRRDRCVILAYANGKGLQRSKQRGASNTGRTTESHESACQCGSPMANTQRIGRGAGGDKSNNDCKRNDSASEQGWRSELCPAGCGGSYVPDTDGAMPSDTLRAWRGQSGFGNIGRWSAEPDVGRVAHGIPHRVDRLRCLGNAVVPQQFYPVFRAIADIERSLYENK